MCYSCCRKTKIALPRLIQNMHMPINMLIIGYEIMWRQKEYYILTAFINNFSYLTLKISYISKYVILKATMQFKSWKLIFIYITSTFFF